FRPPCRPKWLWSPIRSHAKPGPPGASDPDGAFARKSGGRAPGARDHPSSPQTRRHGREDQSVPAQANRLLRAPEEAYLSFPGSNLGLQVFQVPSFWIDLARLLEFCDCLILLLHVRIDLRQPKVSGIRLGINREGRL